MSVYVALQVGVEAWCWREEGQADGHQLPASLQAVVAEVLCGLTTQLDVEFITQTLVTPPTHNHLMETGTKPVSSLYEQVADSPFCDHFQGSSQYW